MFVLANPRRTRKAVLLILATHQFRRREGRSLPGYNEWPGAAWKDSASEVMIPDPASWSEVEVMILAEGHRLAVHEVTLDERFTSGAS